MDELKKTIFYEMLGLAGRVFIVVKHSPEVMIGTRGFTEEEIKNGIVLVFNGKMNFSWGDRGISTSLVFGSTSQKCFIPAGDIMVIYSPELNAQFMTSPLAREDELDPKENSAAEEAERRGNASDNSKVVKVDFQKKRSRIPKQ
ncbi:MAG TPA: ClpXP protease specificity-enhancing factor SspB [Thermodesulfovibrionales bacterium]|nr:ClpXP protease specificity-enhancing factor SspB [Thermodesulfovibrionales bacterium]